MTTSINPDAHSIKEIDNIRWGIYSGSKRRFDYPYDLECYEFKGNKKMARP